MSRKNAATSIGAMIAISAIVFGIRLFNNHSNDFYSSDEYQSIATQGSIVSSMAESIRISQEDAMQESITYGEIKGSFDEGIYSNERTGVDLNIPDDFYVASDETSNTLICSDFYDDSDILTFNDSSSDIHFISNQGNAINIDLVYVPGFTVDISSVSTLSNSVTEHLTEDRGYINRVTNIEFVGTHMYSTVCFDYVGEGHSYKVTILLTISNDVATIITLIDTNESDLMSAIIG